MRRILGGAAAILLIALSGVHQPVFATPIIALDNGNSDIASRAFEQIGSCLSPEDAELNVLFVLDASSSLPEDTDKEGLRGDILAQAISQLDSLAENREVNIAVSSFDLNYQVRSEWQSLEEESSRSLRKQIPGWVNDWWGRGGGTNWEAALSGGAQTMQESPNAKSACKMMIWLTDGGINVDGPREKSVNADAMERICATNPVNGEKVSQESIVAQIRSAGIHLVGVLLKSEKYLDSLDAATLADESSRFSYMLPVTEGSGLVNNAAFTGSNPQDLQYDCGNIPIPMGQAYGALLSGDSPISLGFVFADIANGIRGGVREDLGINFPVKFDIEKGINAASIQIAGKGWVLQSPNGSIFRSSSADFDEIKVSQEGDLANVRIEGDSLPAGEWELDVSDPLASAVIYREIRVDGILSTMPSLQSGETSTVKIEFRDSISESSIPVGVYNLGSLSLEFSQGQSEPLLLKCDASPTVVSFSCPLTPTQVGEGTLKASMDLSTFSGSNKITYLGDFAEIVEPSATFPSVVTSALELSDLIGKNGVALGTVQLKGPAEGSGEICLPSTADTSVVNDVIAREGSYSLTWGGEPGECISLDQGQLVEVPVTIGNDVAASGQAIISLPFILKSDNSQNEQIQDVSATFTTVREGTPNPFILIGLVILGFGIPIALLYLQARSASRLSLTGLQVANIPVEVSVVGDIVRVSRRSGGDLFQIDDWHYFSSSIKQTRSFTAPSGVRLVAKTPKNPLGVLSAIAEAPSGSRVISSEGGITDGAMARVGLSPANQWILSVPTQELLADREVLTGQLVAFANPTGGALYEANQALSLSAQDGLLLGSLVTVRDRLRVESLTSSSTPSAKAQSKGTENQGSSENATQQQNLAESDQVPSEPESPFNSLFGDTPLQTPAPKIDPDSRSNGPPKSSGSGLSNPFENL